MKKLKKKLIIVLFNMKKYIKKGFYKVGDTYYYTKHNPTKYYGTKIKEIFKGENNFIFILNDDNTIFKIGVIIKNKFYPRLP